MRKDVSCGVLVTDGERLLMGHSTGSRHWDIPKGVAEWGESEVEAAIRELREETGLVVSPDELESLGRLPYNKDKDLSLFLLRRDPLPDPAALLCTSMVVVAGGEQFPELDDFELVPWDRVAHYAAPRMGMRLTDIRMTVEAACGLWCAPRRAP